MTRETRILDSLERAFAPIELQVTDDSAKHVGHAGAQPGGETHYNVHIVAEAFIGQSRVAMQRAIMAALQAEFDSGLHALAIKASAPKAAGECTR